MKLWRAVWKESRVFETIIFKRANLGEMSQLYNQK